LQNELNLKFCENLNFITFDKLNINLGKTYAKLRIFPKIFLKIRPLDLMLLGKRCACATHYIAEADLVFFRSWRPCYSAELMKHYHSACVAVYTAKELFCEHNIICTWLLYLLTVIWNAVY